MQAMGYEAYFYEPAAAGTAMARIKGGAASALAQHS
jgi:hypothetical protein